MRYSSAINRRFKSLFIILSILLMVSIAGTVYFSSDVIRSEITYMSSDRGENPPLELLDHATQNKDGLILQSHSGISLVGLMLAPVPNQEIQLQLDIQYGGTAPFILTTDVYGAAGAYDDPGAQREIEIGNGTTHLDYRIPMTANHPDKAYLRLFGQLPGNVTITRMNVTGIRQAFRYPEYQFIASLAVLIAFCLLLALGSMRLYQQAYVPQAMCASGQTEADMLNEKRLSSMLRICLWTSAAFAVLYCYFRIRYNTILFADGSFSVVNALSTITLKSLLQGFSGDYLSRVVSHTLFFVYSVLLKLAGVKSLAAIVSAVAFGHVSWAFLFWGITMFYARKARNLSVMALTILLGCFSLFFTGFFMSIESGILAAAYWLVLTYVLYFHTVLKSAGTRLVILLTALAMAGIHEFSSVMALMIIAIICVQLYRGKIRMDIFWTVLVMVLAFASFIGWKGIIQPRDSGTRSQFIHSLFAIEKTTLLICVLMFAGFLAALFTMGGNRKHAAIRKAAFWIEGVTSVALLILALFRYQRVAYDSYDARMMNFLFPFALTIWVCLIEWMNIHVSGHLLVSQALPFLVAVLVFTALSSITYSAYLKGVSDYLTVRPGIHEVSEYNGPFSGYGWGWSAAYESLLSQTIYDGKTVITGALSPNDGGWEPFDSENPSAYPDLSAYGISYALDG